HAIKITIPAGERTKSFDHYHQVIEQILSYQPTRETCLVAIGGGATGDFTGFLAATLLRGVHFIQVPTTILAHDSSVGGKVGINSQHGKNLIGAFHRPNAVVYDLDFLQTLPYEEVLSGYTEVYKHALLSNPYDFQSIENAFPNQSKLQSLKDIEHFIFKGIQTKLEIITEDEKEQGKRKFLNLGHTFGHAIEYQYKIPHGHAIMFGIIYQFIVANEILRSNFNIKHFVDYAEKLQYPTQFISTMQFDQLYHLMLGDKKNNGKGIQMVLLKSIGQPVVQHVDKDILHKAFKDLLSYYK
nr:3-dehydroquinate synthase [Staphylococcus lugdunensis]